MAEVIVTPVASEPTVVQLRFPSLTAEPSLKSATLSATSLSLDVASTQWNASDLEEGHCPTLAVGSDYHPMSPTPYPLPWPGLMHCTVEWTGKQLKYDELVRYRWTHGHVAYVRVGEGYVVGLLKPVSLTWLCFFEDLKEAFGLYRCPHILLQYDGGWHLLHKLPTIAGEVHEVAALSACNPDTINMVGRAMVIRTLIFAQIMNIRSAREWNIIMIQSRPYLIALAISDATADLPTTTYSRWFASSSFDELVRLHYGDADPEKVGAKVTRLTNYIRLVCKRYYIDELQANALSAGVCKAIMAGVALDNHQTDTTITLSSLQSVACTTD